MTQSRTARRNVPEIRRRKSRPMTAQRLAPATPGDIVRGQMSNSPLSSQVYDQLLRRLLSGELPPGHVFNRRQVAAELGVSVAPVLEAMLELEAEGLIE